MGSILTVILWLLSCFSSFLCFQKYGFGLGNLPVNEEAGTRDGKDPGGMEGRKDPAAMKPERGPTAARDASFPRKDEDENWTW